MQQVASLSERLTMRSAWETVHLAETIQHAYANTEFYQEHWRAHGVDPSHFRDSGSLALFPIVRKADFAARPASLVSRADPPDSIRDTSGTTGVRLPIYTNAHEDLALAGLRRGRSKGHPHPTLVLRVLPPPRRLKPAARQQHDMEEGGFLLMHILPGQDPNVWYDSVDMLVSVLSERYFVGTSLHSVDLIHTTPPPLFEYVSRSMRERGLEPRRFNVKEVLLTGGPLTGTSRHFLSELWNAPVVTTYSCTEVHGEALECPDNRLIYHPTPSMVAEVLDGATGRNVDDGEVGEVALTALYPFQRVMPMVRYLPGDLARFHAAPCRCGSATVGIEFLGRSIDMLDLSDLAGRACRIGTRSVLEAIAPFPQVPQFPYPRAEFARTGDAGRTVEIRAECADPRSFDAAEIERRILDLLSEHDGELDLLCRTGVIDLAVSLVPKNSLKNYFRLYPGR
jgi:phenylacetate-coenzyme A ligase PaaK-like adenylate-forming protein